MFKLQLNKILLIISLVLMGYTNSHATWNTFASGNGSASNPWTIQAKHI